MIVPPVPAPATKASTFMDEGFDEVDGVETTASINSGPVVCSWANGLFGYRLPSEIARVTTSCDTYIMILVKNDCMRYFTLKPLGHSYDRQRNSATRVER